MRRSTLRLCASAGGAAPPPPPETTTLAKSSQGGNNPHDRSPAPLSKRFDSPLRAVPKLEMGPEKNTWYYTNAFRQWVRRRGLITVLGITFYMSSIGLTTATVDASESNRVLGMRYRYWRAKRNLDILEYKPPTVIKQAEEVAHQEKHILGDDDDTPSRRQIPTTPHQEEDDELIVSWTSRGRPLSKVASQVDRHDRLNPKGGLGDVAKESDGSMTAVMTRLGMKLYRQLPNTFSWAHPLYTKDAEHKWRYNWVFYKLQRYEPKRTLLIPIDAVSADGLYNIHMTAKFTFYMESLKKRGSERYKWNRLANNEGEVKLQYVAQDELQKWAEQAAEVDLQLTPLEASTEKIKESLCKANPKTIRDEIKDPNDLEEHLRRYIVGRVIARTDGAVLIENFWWKIHLEKRARADPHSAERLDPMNHENWGL